MRPCLILKQEDGFSLLEISVAALLLTGVMAGLYSSFVTANRWIQPQSNAAYSVARERLESLHEYVRQDWWASAGHPLSVGGPNPDGSATIDDVSYAREYSVINVDSDSDGVQDYRRAQVTVSWT
jgi:hypothetical protein